MTNLVQTLGQVKKLKNGVGIQSLLDSAYKIMGNPIVLFNTEYNLLAHTNSESDDKFWNEITTTGTFSKETQKLFGKEGFIEELTNSPKSVLFKSEKLKYDRIVGKVFNKNNSYVSNLVIVASNKPFEENDKVVFETICKLISKEISQDKLYQEYEQEHQETIINKLIDGNYDMKLDIAQIGIIYDTLKSGLYVVTVDISQCDLDNTSAEYYKNLLIQTEPKFKYSIFSNHIVIIISTDDDIINVNKELDKLIKIFEQHNMYAGISSRFENLFELQKYYMEALESMQYTLETKSNQRIFPYNDSSRNKMKQINKLENGKGIQYFLNKGFEIFGNPLLFHDMEPNLLGYTENVEIVDPIWQELITYGTGSDETVELFKTEGWVDIMDKTKGGALLVSDKCKYDRISWRIYNSDNIRFGCTSIVNTMKPFSEDELVLFGIFSQKFSKEVKKIEIYNNIGQVYSETVINRLISGKIDDYTFYSEDISNLYDDNFMESLYLIVVDTSQCDTKKFNLTYLRDLFNRPGTINRYAIHDDYIIIITSMDEKSFNENDKFNEISKIFKQSNLYAGISSSFDNIYELKKHYKEAVKALKTGIKNKTNWNKN